MPKSPGKPIEVTVIIKSGAASPSQKQAWKRFFRKLIAEVKADGEYDCTKR